MVLISQGEIDFIAHGLENGIRNDGRSPLAFRSLKLESGVLQQSSGSARCVLGRTEVLVAVKADVGVPFPEQPDHGSIDYAVAFSPCALKGAAGDTLGDELGEIIGRSLRWQQHGTGCALDLSVLKIISGKRCWVLQLDGLVLSADGNLMGALSMATKAALADLRIPKIDVTMGEEDDEPELDLDDDPEQASSLDTSRVPIIVTISQVVDLTEEEEASCQDRAVHVAVNAKGGVCGISKSESTPVPPGKLLDMVETACAVASKVHVAIDGQLQKAGH